MSGAGAGLVAKLGAGTLPTLGRNSTTATTLHRQSSGGVGGTSMVLLIVNNSANIPVQIQPTLPSLPTTTTPACVQIISGTVNDFCLRQQFLVPSRS
jgi:hypothetical protein